MSSNHGIDLFSFRSLTSFIRWAFETMQEQKNLHMLSVSRVCLPISYSDRLNFISILLICFDFDGLFNIFE